MRHGFLGGQSFLEFYVSPSTNIQHHQGAYLVIVSKQLVQKVDGIITHKALVLRIDEAVPVLSWETSQNIVVLSIKLDIVPVKVLKQIIRAKHFCNLAELIRVAVAVEKGLLSEEHRSEHSTQ